MQPELELLPAALFFLFGSTGRRRGTLVHRCSIFVRLVVMIRIYLGQVSARIYIYGSVSWKAAD